MPSPQIKCIFNFRDVAQSTNSSVFHNGRVFRSGRLDNADQFDIKTLVEECNICTVLDLRTGIEARTSTSLQTAFPRALVSSNLLEIFDPVISDQSDHPYSPNITVPEKNERIKPNTTDSQNIRRSFHIDLLGKEYRMKAVWGQASLRIKLTVIFYLLLFMKKTATSFISKNLVAKKGLLGLYIDIIEFCKPQLLTSFKIILAYAHEPLLIHCSHGKDRTGIVIALLLSVLGVPRDDIVADYANSSKLLSPFQEQIDLEFDAVGLNGEFATARAETMNSLLSYMEAKYGSAIEYLETIGFDKSHQNALRSKLLIKKQSRISLMG